MSTAQTGSLWYTNGTNFREKLDTRYYKEWCIIDYCLMCGPVLYFIQNFEKGNTFNEQK